MKIFRKSGRELVSSPVWFSESIESDPWVAYHATSSVHAESIDAVGLSSSQSGGLADAAVQAAEFFVSTGWSGFTSKDCGSVALLGCSLQRSHAEGGRPLFLALYPQRPWLYLKSDFCGGESAHALARAIPAINEFAFNDAELDAHFRGLEQRCIARVQRGQLPLYRVIEPNKNWIRAQAVKLLPALSSLNTLRSQHRHGVLYAVRLERSDLNPSRYEWGDGLRVFKDVPRERFVAKLEVSGEDDLQVLSMMEEEAPPIDFDSLNFWRSEGTIAQAAANAPMPPDPDGADLKRRMVNRDAGPDITLQLAREHGTADVCNWAERQLSLPEPERYYFYD